MHHVATHRIKDPRLAKPLVVALSLAALSMDARGQALLFTIEGSAATNNLGATGGMESLGDVDGDGTPDFALSERVFDGVAGVDCGRVEVWSGRTGTVVRAFEGGGAGDLFGTHIRNVLDLDGDGTDDLAIAAPGFPGGASQGKVYAYSGATGALLWSVAGENAGDRFSSPRGVGDATGDGINDVLMTAIGFAPNPAGFGAGKAYVCSGLDGSVQATWVGTPGAELGWNAGALRFDANGDGRMDVVVGSREERTSPQGPGRVEVFGVGSAAAIVTFAGGNAGDLRCFTDDAADVDGDGVPDLLIGAPGQNGGLGVVELVSGANWSVTRSWLGTPEIKLGALMKMAGDVDGDGFGDVFLPYSGFDSAANADAGVLLLISGANGRELTRFVGEQAVGLLGANRAVNAGDLDGDGIFDHLVNAPAFNGVAGSRCGKVYAFAGNDLYLNCSHEVAHANDTVTLLTTAGEPGNLVIDVLVELDGVAMFQLITPHLAFDPNGELAISDVIDPAWGVHDATFQSYAIGRNRKLIASNTRELALR